MTTTSTAPTPANGSAARRPTLSSCQGHGHTAGRYSGDAILDNFDAVQVLQADEAGDFLRQGRVTFLLGPEPAAFDSIYFDSTYTDTFILEGMEYEFELYGEMESSDPQE